MKRKALAAACMSVFLLAGCTSKVKFFRTVQSTVGINADGSVYEVMMESFDQDYYSIDDLSSYINEQVNEFNEENPQEQPETSGNFLMKSKPVQSVTLGKIQFDEKKKTVRATLEYLNIDLYNAFNHADIRIMTLEEAKEETDIASLEQMLRFSNGNPVAFSDFENQEGLKVLVTSTPLCIRMAGAPLYYTNTATLIDHRTIQTSEGETIIVFK